jgi:hypothetical protein
MKRIVCAVLIALLAVPCVSIADSSSEEVGRGDRFIAHADGVVYDTKTGLEWYAGPNKDTKWKQAKRWTERLQVAGGGWRLPTIKELKALYEKDVGTRNMTPLLKTTGWLIWSGETKGSFRAWGFHFGPGYEFYITRDISHNAQGFAVRSRK